MQVLVLIGGIASGKTSLAKELSSRGFVRVSFGAQIQKACVALGQSPTRENLQSVGQELVETDHEQLVHAVLSQAGTQARQVVVDGVRHGVILDDILRIHPHAIVAFIDVQPEVRKTRFVGRSELDRDAASREFDLANEHIMERQLSGLVGRSTIVLSGELTVLEWIEQLGY